MAEYRWDRGTRHLDEDAVELAKLYLEDGLAPEEVVRRLRDDGVGSAESLYCTTAAQRGKEPIDG